MFKSRKKVQSVTNIERYNPSVESGLVTEQINKRKEEKLVNNTKQKTSKSYFRIFFDNICTYFNLIWLLIFVALLVVKSYTNLFFMLVIVFNTAIAIFQEIRSKRTVEKLSMITLPKTKVVRNGEEIEILSEEIVLDDILVLEIGNQIPTDAVILNGYVEVNESLLTGESKPIKKENGANLFAGSFITSGKCYAKADKIGKESYIQTIASAAKKFKQPNSNLFKDLNKIIKWIGIFIIPIGALTFVNCYIWSGPTSLSDSVAATCGSLTGMIPAGMFLLISVALAVGVIKLGQRKTLVQDIYAIEMLARSNVLCLDKTGTITDGTMTVKELKLFNETEEDAKKAVSAVLSAQNTENNTREFDMDCITTVPNVSYKVYTTQGEVLDVHNPSGLPAITLIDRIEEPYIRAQIISKSDFFGPIMKLCLDKRGTLVSQHFLTSDRVELNYDMPLSEIVFDFYDKLKSISKGYASFDYHITGYREADLVKLDILLNGEGVDALSSLIHRDHAYDFGRKMCEKLRELIPRQQFDIAIQAAIGAKIIARETVKAVRKDVTAKCYGGDISRKRKLLEKQKKGKRRMRQVGNVEVPQSAFMAVLKLD